MDHAEDRSPVLPPDEAFALLGNETRVRILQTLGNEGGPLSFTELRDGVGLEQGSQFNYHLDKLVGHFVAKSADGYELRQPGRAVVEAVLSGAVTDDPVVEPTAIDRPCLLCGGPIRVSYRAERVELYCTECDGQYGERVEKRDSSFVGDHGYLGGYRLPPAGVVDRTPGELLEASSLWTHLAGVALANELCPRCGGVVAIDVDVCERHDRSEGLCPTCDLRHAVQVERTCRNCQYVASGMAINVLAAKPELRTFVAEQGIDPIVEGFKWGWDCREEVHSIDPFKADFSFEIDGATITLHTGDRLDVLDVTRGRTTRP